MTKPKADDNYTEDEAERRFKATVQAALNTSPKPHKEAVTKGDDAKPTSRRPAASS